MPYQSQLLLLLEPSLCGILMNLARAIFLAATTSGIRPGQSPPALVVLTLVRGLFSMQS